MWYLFGAMCRLSAYGPICASAIPECYHLLLRWNPELWFCFLVPAYSGSPAEETIKRVLLVVFACSDDLLLMSTPPHPLKETTAPSSSAEPSTAANSLDKILNCTPSDVSTTVRSVENVCNRFYILVWLDAIVVYCSRKQVVTSLVSIVIAQCLFRNKWLSINHSKKFLQNWNYVADSWHSFIATLQLQNSRTFWNTVIQEV